MEHHYDRTVLELDEAPEPERSGEDLYEDEAEDFEDQLSLEDQLAFAGDLLEVSDERELEEFLGGLVNKAVGAARRFASSPRGKAVGSALKQALKDALPSIGRAIGNRVSPGAGDLGAQLAGDLGSALEVELEGYSQADRDFEAARHLVRLICHAAHHAHRAPRGMNPDDVAHAAVEAAFERYAPELAARTGDADADLAGAGQVLSPLSDEEEDYLANELLEVLGDDELEQFLGKVIRTAARKPAKPAPAAPRPRPAAQHPAARKAGGGQGGISGWLRSPTAHALGGVLKQVAKSALPTLGTGLGDLVLPGIGGVVGGDLGSAVSDLFEIEPEEGEDAEMEAARRIVGLSAAAAHHLACNPSPGTSPRAAAWSSVLDASQTYAPGLHRRLAGPPETGNGNGRRRRHRHGHHVIDEGPVIEGGVIEEGVVDAEPDDAHDGLPLAGTWRRHGHRIILTGI